MSAERTLVVLKPDALQRGIAFEILSRFEKRGLRFAALRLLNVDRAMAEKHYAVHKGKFFYNDLVAVIIASPVVAAVLEGPNAIAVVRAMVGSTRPHEASEGSIRGDSRSSVSETWCTRAMLQRRRDRRSSSGSRTESWT